MSYSNPTSGTHMDPAGIADFGDGAATTFYISGPAGKQGKLRSISVSTTEAFLCDLTEANVAVGTAADADAYGLLNITDGTAVNTVFNETNDTDAIIAADIAADTQVLVTITNGTDGTGVTGKGQVTVYIDWF